MDLATLVGLIAAFGVIFSAIFLGGSASTFISVPSLIIVIGGTFAVTLMQISVKQFFGSFKVALRAFMNKVTPADVLIKEAVDLADTARKEGLLALEGRKISDPFLKKGVRMCIDGHASEVIHKMLVQQINLQLERENVGAKMFKSIGDSAPAMGMIGTLIGLVQMLANMDDPKSIGPAMAVALLTTLYGAIIATAIGLPISEKLRGVSAAETLNKKLILESIAAIQEGTNPRILKQMLTAYLPEESDGKKGKK
ncbi:MAG TPA: flagellar motor protein PomA [Gammaproteobacteria bacterium]|nr:flagellar motor protein PomA [Gammaproteobacteria bacterium]